MDSAASGGSSIISTGAGGSVGSFIIDYLRITSHQEGNTVIRDRSFVCSFDLACVHVEGLLVFHLVIFFFFCIFFRIISDHGRVSLTTKKSSEIVPRQTCGGGVGRGRFELLAGILRTFRGIRAV